MDFTDQYGVTFLEIFTWSLADRVNVIFPLQCAILHPINFGLVIQNKTAKITRTSANLKPVTQAKPFSGFEIIQVEDLGYHP